MITKYLTDLTNLTDLTSVVPNYAYMYVTHRMAVELSFILECVYELNGRHIFTGASVSHRVDFVESARYVLEVQHSVKDIPNLFVSDASESHAFVYCADGTFAYVSDFEFSATEATLSSGHRELLSIVFALDTHPEVFCQFSPGKIFWQTDSKNVFNFLRRSSRKTEIQADVVKIKKLEKKLSVKIIPAWTPREHARLQLEDLGSKFSTSTDEWSVARPVIDAVLNCIHVQPTIDAFASVHNKICERFFFSDSSDWCEWSKLFCSDVTYIQKRFIFVAPLFLKFYPVSRS